MGERTGRRRSWRRWAALGLILAVSLIVGAPSALWLLSWKVRIRGLERWIEGRIREATSLDVRIGSVASYPLSEFVMTEVRSLEAGGDGPIAFSCPRITLLYDPLQLLSGEIRELRMEGLKLRIDADRLRQLPIRSGADSAPSLRCLSIEAPEATIIAGGKAHVLRELRLRFGSLREDPAIPFDLSARSAGSSLEVWGTVQKVPEGIRIGEAHFQVREADLASLAERLPVPLPGKGAGRLRIDGTARGIWPRRVTWRIETRLDGLDLSTDALEAEVRSGTVDLTLSGAVEGAFRAADIACEARGRLRWGPALRELAEGWTLRWSGRYEAAGAPGGGALWRFGPSRFSVNDLGSIELSGEVRDLLGRPQLDLAVDARAGALSLLARRLQLLRLAGLDGSIGSALRDLETALRGLAGRGEIRTRIRGEPSAPEFDVTLQLARAGFRAEPIRIADAKLEVRLAGRPGRWRWQADGTLGELRRAGAPGLAALALTGSGAYRSEAREIAVDALRLAAPEGPPITIGGAFTRDGYRNLRASIGPAEIPRVRDLLAALGLPTRGIPRGLDGEVEATVACPRGTWEGGRHAFEGEVKIEDGSYAPIGGPDGISGFRAGVAFEGTADPERVAVRIRSEPRFGEVLWGPFWRDTSGDRFSVSARLEADLRLERLRIAEATVRLPAAGRIRIAGWIDPDRARVTFEAPDADSAAVVEIFRDGLGDAVPALAGLALTGRSAWTLTYLREDGRRRAFGEVEIRPGAGPIASTGDARAARDPARFALGPLRLEDVTARIPFGFGGPAGGADPRTGRIRFASLRLGPFALPGAELALGWDGASWRAGGEIRGPLAGGEVAMADLALERPFARGGRLGFSLGAEAIDLAALTKTLGTIPLRGELSALLPAVRLGGGEASIDGEIELRAFGGLAALRGLRLRGFPSAYTSVEVEEARFAGIRLLELGRTFRFGLISGVAEGWIRNLCVSAGGLEGFEAELETVRRRGVPQHVDRRAIESIGRLTNGPLYQLEKTFFTTFKYDRLGFRCSLKNERFRLRGRYRSGGREYIMLSRWYQFPRIDIVNSNPGIAYDWKAIYENLRAIYRGEREVRVK